MEPQLEQNSAFVGINERGLIRVNFDLVREPNDVPEFRERDPDADPTTDAEWEAMLQREGVRIRGGRGGNGGREVVVPFVQHDVRLPEKPIVESYMRLFTRLTVGESEFYHRQPGVALEVVRAEIGRIIEDGTVSICDESVQRNAKVKFEVYGLTDREVCILRASRSAHYALSAYARKRDGERIRMREAPRR